MLMDRIPNKSCQQIFIKTVGRFWIRPKKQHWPHMVGSVQFSSVAQSCPTLCDVMDCSTPGFPVHHQLPELAQTHVLWVSDAIQPSHPLSTPSPPALNLSQHQGLFQWVSSLHQVGSYLYVWSYCHFVNCFGFVFVGLFSSLPLLFSLELYLDSFFLCVYLL